MNLNSLSDFPQRTMIMHSQRKHKGQQLRDNAAISMCTCNGGGVRIICWPSCVVSGNMDMPSQNSSITLLRSGAMEPLGELLWIHCSYSLCHLVSRSEVKSSVITESVQKAVYKQSIVLVMFIHFFWFQALIESLHPCSSFGISLSSTFYWRHP